MDSEAVEVIAQRIMDSNKTVAEELITSNARIAEALLVSERRVALRLEEYNRLHSRRNWIAIGLNLMIFLVLMSFTVAFFNYAIIVKTPYATSRSSAR